jgi:hypothetical protein
VAEDHIGDLSKQNEEFAQERTYLIEELNRIQMIRRN